MIKCIRCLVKIKLKGPEPPVGKKIRITCPRCGRVNEFWVLDEEGDQIMSKFAEIQERLRRTIEDAS